MKRLQLLIKNNLLEQATNAHASNGFVNVTVVCGK